MNETEIEALQRKLEDVSSTAAASAGSLTFYLIFVGVFGFDFRTVAVTTLVGMWALLTYWYFRASHTARQKLAPEKKNP
jgi:hypothetical protein